MAHRFQELGGGRSLTAPVPNYFRKQANKAVLRCYRNKTSLFSEQASVRSSHPHARQEILWGFFCHVLDHLILVSHLKLITSLSSCYFSFICCLDSQSFIIKRSPRTSREHFDKLEANQFSFSLSQPATCSASRTHWVASPACWGNNIHSSSMTIPLSNTLSFRLATRGKQSTITHVLGQLWTCSYL